MDRQCRDCLSSGITTKRTADYPGPRCYTHHREHKAQQKQHRADSHIKRTYSITPQQYNDILAEQNGLCPICNHAKGISRRLAVDHDHTKCESHPSNEGCPICIRGLLCSFCNYMVLGRLDLAALERAVDYLKNPPAQRVLSTTKEM